MGTEERVRAALRATGDAIRADGGTSLDHIRARVAAARRRRRVGSALAGAAVAVAALIAVPLLQSDNQPGVKADDPAPTSTAAPTTAVTSAPPVTTAATTAPPATTQPVAATPAPPATTLAPEPSWVFALLASDGSADPAETADRFVHGWLGFDNALLGPFVAAGADTGSVAVSSRRENGSPGRVVSTLSLRYVTSAGVWSVESATSDNVVLTTPTAGATVTSPLTAVGRSVGFESTILVDVRDADGTTLGHAVGVTAGADNTTPQPFALDVTIDSPRFTAGAIVAHTDVGAEFATPDFTVVPVKFVA